MKRLCHHMDEETEGRLGQVINKITTFTNSRVRGSSPVFTIAKYDCRIIMTLQIELFKVLVTLPAFPLFSILTEFLNLF